MEKKNFMVKVYESLLCQHGKRIGNIDSIEIMDMVIDSVNFLCDEESF